MDGYNYSAHRDVSSDRLPWWRNRFEGMWGLLFLIMIGATSFATIILFNGALPAIPGE